MIKSTAVAFAIVVTSIMLGYVGGALLETDAGRMILGTIAGMLMLATCAAIAGALLSRNDGTFAD